MKAPDGQTQDEAGCCRPVADGGTRLDLVDRVRIKSCGAEARINLDGTQRPLGRLAHVASGGIAVLRHGRVNRMRGGGKFE